MELSDRELVERWQAGDREAAGDLYTRYFQKLAGLACRHLGEKLQGRMDPEDLVQTAFRSILMAAKKRTPLLADDADFWKWMVSVALNKIFKKIKYESAQCRNPTREKGPSPSADFDRSLAEMLSSRQPGVEDVLEFSDLVETLLQRLGSRQGAVLLCRLDGQQYQEIAKEFGVDERTIRRDMTEIRRVAEELTGGSAPPQGEEN
jgi:RNA polymerase sigma factor (sigma-70 family)